MKEYLNPLKDGGYELSNDELCENSIEVPSGAEIAIRFNRDIEGHGVIFYKNDGKASASEKYNFKWNYNSHWNNAELLDENFAYGDIDLSHKVLWQRPTNPEQLPFIDDEPQSLNDQYAEIEQVRQELKGVDATLAQRQSEYGSFEDVAFVTENIMSILVKVRVKGLQDLPNTHRMALYMIASKMARIVNGDFNKLDSWHDIGGYAKLIENLIEGK